MARRKLKTEIAEPTPEPVHDVTPVEPAVVAEAPIHPGSTQETAETPATPEPETPAKSYGPNPFGVRADVVAGVRLQEDKRYRQMQLKFDAKPSDEVRHAVREAGFQWRSHEQVWSKPIDPDRGWQTRAAAEALFDRVAGLIRTALGHGHAVG